MCRVTHLSHIADRCKKKVILHITVKKKVIFHITEKVILQITVKGSTQAKHDISQVSPCPKGLVNFINGFKYKPHHNILEVS